MDNLAAEVDELLQQAGQIDLATMTSRFNLPSDYLLRVGSRLQGMSFKGMAYIVMRAHLTLTCVETYRQGGVDYQWHAGWGWHLSFHHSIHHPPGKGGVALR